ncbi:HipA domain-containing protein [Cyanobium sp. BA20m-14]|uniref:HipA domain-containing protein n=1 Tax=Cyanobium sp. BA20m-14 TaxID=2823703 RepID=UPI0020CD8C8E|nr:HipA domain-containing protein [Cyanobium sp. BA20m-14]MCP9914081.1 HipA domain-containing protein [Cyanobium sp. BA20m-14]
MNGMRVGTWSLPARGPQEFSYREAWLRSSQFRPLSLSLPAGLGASTLRGTAVESWFDNLLPAASTSAFDLLAAIGRDCAGAMQLLPPEQEPSGIDRIKARPLSDQEIGQRLRTVTAAPAPGSLSADADELRLSVAGAQEKTAFLWHNGQWCVPLESTPTTHLFKLSMGIIGEGQIDFSTSVENEWLCGRILHAFGLPVAPSEIASFDGQRCLIVERFDRKLHASGSHWLWLPTEDCCQATATPATMKYENNGGPGMVAIAELLAQSSEPSDLATFFKAQVLFWMLRAIDGHAKNFSLFHNSGGRFQLTPLYDVFSAWPVIGRRSGQWPQQKLRMDMAWHGEKGSYTKPLEITARRMLLTAKGLGLVMHKPSWTS